MQRAVLVIPEIQAIPAQAGQVVRAALGKYLCTVAAAHRAGIFFVVSSPEEHWDKAAHQIMALGLAATLEVPETLGVREPHRLP